MIKRMLQDIIMKRVGKGKVILIFGPRQAGKTTLAEQISRISGLPTLWLNGDEPDIRAMLSDATSARLKAIIGKHELIVIDEAQRITNIGLTLKLLADQVKTVKVIATGSSAFELANTLNEPLTGRKYEFYLYPLSFAEMVNYTGILEEKRLLEHRMIYGYYPEVVVKQSEEQELLSLLADSYLYKDLFALDRVKKPSLFERIVQGVALQLGKEVSYNELSQIAGADKETIERYIDLLEKAFVVFRLPSFSRNLRNELKRSRKIYFWDNGIRNAVIKNFNPLSLRQDTDALWENFLISERRKANHYAGRLVNSYFWRTHAQQEIDYIEEYGGRMYAWEFKWRGIKKPTFPRSFLAAYPNSTTRFIDRDTFEEFVLDNSGLENGE